jgi:hypothetical protein
MSSNLCVICAIDMGEDNPRQLCGKTDCHEESDYFELLSSQLRVRCDPGWINSLGIAIENSDNSSQILKRLIFNLNKYWDSLKDIPIVCLVNMDSSKMIDLVRVRESKPLPIITQPTYTTLESIHESSGNWFRD